MKKKMHHLLAIVLVIIMALSVVETAVPALSLIHI